MHVCSKRFLQSLPSSGKGNADVSVKMLSTQPYFFQTRVINSKFPLEPYRTSGVLQCVIFDFCQVGGTQHGMQFFLVLRKLRDIWIATSVFYRSASNDRIPFVGRPYFLFDLQVYGKASNLKWSVTIQYQTLFTRCMSKASLLECS